MSVQTSLLLKCKLCAWCFPALRNVNFQGLFHLKTYESWTFWRPSEILVQRGQGSPRGELRDKWEKNNSRKKRKEQRQQREGQSQARRHGGFWVFRRCSHWRVQRRAQSRTWRQVGLKPEAFIICSAQMLFFRQFIVTNLSVAHVFIDTGL